MSESAGRRSTLPGFGLTLGFTLLYLFLATTLAWLLLRIRTDESLTPPSGAAVASP